MLRFLRTIAILISASAAASGQDLKFEVASVKPAAPLREGAVRIGTGGGPGTFDPGQINSSGVTLKSLLTTAFAVQAYQITGPDWLDTERYDIIAKVPPGTTKEQVNVMWQNLLAERFGMVLHHESKEFKAEELTVAKGGPKLKETDVDPNAPPPNGGLIKTNKNGVAELTGPGLVFNSMNLLGKAQTMSKLADLMGRLLKHPVIDKTGLTGKYDFIVEYGEPGPGGPDKNGDLGSDLSAAVQKQLGLKLVSSKVLLDIVVIERANKVPTDN